MSYLQSYVIHILLQPWNESATFKNFLSLSVRSSELCVTSPCRPPLPHLVFLLPRSPALPSISYYRTFVVTLLAFETNTSSFKPYLLGRHHRRSALQLCQKLLPQLRPQPPLCRCLSLYISQHIWLPYSLVVSIDSYRQGSYLPCLPWCHRSKPSCCWGI